MRALVASTILTVAPARRRPNATATRRPIAPATRRPIAAERLGIIALALLGILAATGPASALDYVQSSAGLEPPEFEGGRTELEFVDIDADGHIDLVSIGDHGSPFVNTDQHGIMVWFGDGHGGWSVHMNGNFGYGGIAIGDLNNDGLADAAYGMHHDYSGTDFGDQILEAALGDGTGRNWTPWDDGLATNGESWGMFGTDLGDVDNDGDLDIGSNSFGCCAGVHVYRNHLDGSWTQSWGYLGGNSSMWFEFGDINADGFLDFATANQTGTVYLGDGEGGFTNADGNLPGTGNLRGGTALGDIDGDGDLDLSYTLSAGIQVWRWEAGGVWTDASAGLPTSGVGLTELADMDGDGVLDLVAMGSSMIRVWKGDGGSSWTLIATIPLASPGSSQAMRVGGDIDHNGLPDIAVLSTEGSWPSDYNHLRVFRETSVATELAARFVAPLGGETVFGGSVRFVHWAAAIPGGEAATTDLWLSTTGPDGPWTPVATAVTSAERYQWTVPVVPATTDARLRIRLTAGGESVEAVTPRSFTILPPVSTSVEGSTEGSIGGGSSEGSAPGTPVVQRFSVEPNPSTGAVRIEWRTDGADAPDLLEALRIVDPAGRIVRVIEGDGALTWDGLDASGRPVPGGVYLARRGDAQARIVRLR